MENEWRTGWLDTFRRLVDVEIERKKVEVRILGEIKMQGQQLTDAVTKLTQEVARIKQVAEQHTPDSQVTPVVQQILSLAEQLRQTFPQA